MNIALTCDAIDFYRSNKNKSRYESISIDNIDEIKVSASLNGEVGTYFFDFCEEEIENPKLKFTLSKLTQRQRAVFELYVEGYKTRDIATKIGITETNVTVTISNTKKKLIKLMKG